MVVCHLFPPINLKFKKFRLIGGARARGLNTFSDSCNLRICPLYKKRRQPSTAVHWLPSTFMYYKLLAIPLFNEVANQIRTLVRSRNVVIHLCASK